MAVFLQLLAFQELLLALWFKFGKAESKELNFILDYLAEFSQSG